MKRGAIHGVGVGGGDYNTIGTMMSHKGKKKESSVSSNKDSVNSS